jgi:hypothetical protein
LGSGGSTGTYTGGNGGQGISSGSSTVGNGGTAPGGAGSGAYSNGSNKAGGAGANGQVIITYSTVTVGSGAYSGTTICSGQTASVIGVSAAGGSGAGYTYQWWSYLTSAGSGTAAFIPGATNATYSPGAITASTSYY